MSDTNMSRHYLTGRCVPAELSRNREFYRTTDIRPPFTYASLIRQVGTYVCEPQLCMYLPFPMSPIETSFWLFVYFLFRFRRVSGFVLILCRNWLHCSAITACCNILFRCFRALLLGLKPCLIHFLFASPFLTVALSFGRRSWSLRTNS